jgi:kynurenine formamidase
LGRYANYTIWETLNGRKKVCVRSGSDVRWCPLRIGAGDGGVVAVAEREQGCE